MRSRNTEDSKYRYMKIFQSTLTETPGILNIILVQFIILYSDAGRISKYEKPGEQSNENYAIVTSFEGLS